VERRLTRRGLETRQRIVGTAADLMFEYGIADTSIDGIRSAAGVSSSQVYLCFAGK
jgi:TetR/AcrR family transcriptional repressor of nem operon